MITSIFKARTVPGLWINTLPAPFNAHGDSVMSAFRRHRGTEKSSELLKVTQVVSDSQAPNSGLSAPAAPAVAALLHGLPAPWPLLTSTRTPTQEARCWGS